MISPNRWVAGALPAIAIHISIGSVYSWSALSKPIQAQMGAEESTIKWAFSIAIFFLGLSAAFLGRFVQDFGPRISARIAGVAFGIGTMGAGLAMQTGSIPLLFLFYGVIGGIGLGTGYITPVKTLIQWFYDHKGLATGLAVMGFGFGSVIAGPVYNTLFDVFSTTNPDGSIDYNCAPAFYLMGLLYLFLIVGASFVIRVPPSGWGVKRDASGAVIDQQRQYTTREALHTWQFYALWIMLFVNITVGISIIYTASPMLQETVLLPAGYSVASAASGAAVLAVSVVALFNGIGRFIWPALSDKVGRPLVFAGFFVIQIIAFGSLSVLLRSNPHQAALLGLIYIIATCYGGGFGTIPAYLSDLFGNASVSAIHGCVLTAWSIAGIAGPSIVVWAKGTPQPMEGFADLVTFDYGRAMLIYVAMLAVALIVALILLISLKRTGDQGDPLAPRRDDRSRQAAAGSVEPTPAIGQVTPSET